MIPLRFVPSLWCLSLSLNCNAQDRRIKAHMVALKGQGKGRKGVLEKAYKRHHLENFGGKPFLNNPAPLSRQV